MPLGSSDRLLSTTTNNDQFLPTVAMSANRVLVGWHSMDNGSNYDIRARVLDAESMTAMQGQDFLLSTASANNQTMPNLTIWGSKAFSAWQSEQAAFANRVRSATVTLPGIFLENSGPIQYGANNFFTAPLIERNYEATAQIVK
jgi:hypothetical protein